MPNWCYNTLVVSGPERQLQAFKRRAERPRSYEPAASSESKFTLGRFLPVPRALQQTRTGHRRIGHHDVSVWREVNNKVILIPADTLALWKQRYGATSWYDWNCKRYGTKWDVQGMLRRSAATKLEYRFDSAWGPPSQGLAAISGLYPQLRFDLNYHCEGCEDDQEELYECYVNGAQL